MGIIAQYLPCSITFKSSFSKSRPGSLRSNILRSEKMKKEFKFLSIIIALFFVVSLYKLDELPGEWFGDISNVHEYVAQILDGQWPFYFFQSPGPVYHYMIAPIVAYVSQNYLGYKISSVVIGLIGLIGTYLFVLEIASRRVALITILVISIS